MTLTKNKLSYRLKRLLLIVFATIIIALMIWFILFFNKESESKEKFSADVPIVKISILNGCGIEGAAAEVKNYLINNNINKIDVISWGNIERDMFIYGKSIIVVKKRNKKKLEYLMQITGINRRIFAVDEDIIEDMQIILGRDYKTIFN